MVQAPPDAPAEKKREQKKRSADSRWVVDINQKIEQTRLDDGSRTWAKLSIYRIPECLRNDDKKSYMPQTVSLGPYHHGKWWLSGMEEHKWRALHQVLKRTDHRVELYIDEAKRMEKDARACYEGPIDGALTSEAFVQMLVLDSTFTLELFRGVDQGFPSLGYSPSDPIFTTSFAKRVTVPSMQRDMIMLENQIPLFVLDRIHGIQSPYTVTSVASLALKFFKRLVATDEERPSNRDESADRSGLHCLDVFRRSLLYASKEACADQETKKENFPHEGRRQPPTGHEDQEIVPRGRPRIHCVTELKEAGVKFRVKETDRFWDIDFNSSSGVLNIPRLLVHHGTKSLFLNLIAFEQYHLACTNGITSYVTFMDRLIESPADVAHLRHRGIVDSCLGSDVEVADLFNCLGHEVEFDIYDSWLFKLSEKINKYYNQPQHAWRASLKQKYFNNPWAIISFIAATILVLLTLAQTFYAVYAYYGPPS